MSKVMAGHETENVAGVYKMVKSLWSFCHLHCNLHSYTSLLISILDDLHLINISCEQNMGSTSCSHLMAYKKRGGGGAYRLLTRFPAIFIVLFPAGFFLLFNFFSSFDAIYCVTQLTSRPFLHHVSQSRALFLPPAPHIQLTQDKLN